MDTTIIPDRIEAATFLAMAAAVPGSSITLEHCEASHMAAAIHKLEQCGCEILPGNREVAISAPHRPAAMNVTTAPFPGFPTDMQAQMMALASVAEGTSVITDTVYLDRFTHVPELQRMGANIELKGNVAVVKGVEQLSGAQVMATDLRASASLVLAGLAARGETLIDRIYHLDRGYEALEKKLGAVGAQIQRLN